MTERHTYIGGSDVAAILGKSPYKNAYDVWLSKHPDYVAPAITDRMQYGLDKEKDLTERCKRELFAEEPQLNFLTQFFAHSNEHDFLGGTIDLYVDSIAEHSERLVIDIKTVDKYAYNNWGDSIPDYYYLQLQHYMYLTGAKKSYLYLDVLGVKYGKFTDAIEYDQQYYEGIVVPALCAFWNEHVLTGVAPDKSAATASVDGKSVDLSHLSEVYNQYREADKAAKELADFADTVKESLKIHAGDAETIIIDGKMVATYKNSKPRATVDSKLLQQTYPDIYSQVLRETPVRAWRNK